MAMQLQRPILIGGLGLTASLWLLDGLGASLTGAGDSLVWAIALGSGIWWLRHRRSPSSSPPVPATDRASIETAVQSTHRLLDQLAQDGEADGAVAERVEQLRSRLAQFTTDLDRDTLQIAIVGEAGVGKTAIADHLTQAWLPQVSWPQGISGVTWSEQSYSDLVDDAQAINAADGVLWVIAGDLTASNADALAACLTAGQRVILVLNKQDQYRDDEQALLLHHVRQRVAEHLPGDAVVAIAAAPAPRKHRKHGADGSTDETWQSSKPDLSALTLALTALVAEGSSLVSATVARQVQQTRGEILAELNQYRRQQALPLIEQAQWIAAAAAFANPVPSLDLLATAAINTQLVVDLGKVYHQSVSLDQAKAVAGTLATLMVQMGVVELSTQAIAPLLKSHALTFAAGGALQGISAAYLTRLAGLSLVDYFQAQSLTETGDRPPFSLQPDALKQRLTRVFQQMSPVGQVRALVEQSLQRFAPTA
jgi:GTPase SAR1 family protein